MTRRPLSAPQFEPRARQRRSLTCSSLSLLLQRSAAELRKESIRLQTLTALMLSLSSVGASPQ